MTDNLEPQFHLPLPLPMPMTGPRITRLQASPTCNTAWAPATMRRPMQHPIPNWRFNPKQPCLVR